MKSRAAAAVVLALLVGMTAAEAGPNFAAVGLQPYEPAKAASKIKGGESNWRGPVWFPTSFLMIE